MIFSYIHSVGYCHHSLLTEGSIMEDKVSLNWNLCCLCQQNTNNEELRCPASQKRFHSAYDTLENDLNDLKNVGAPPKRMEIFASASMLSNRAVYHKSCRTSYNQAAVKRVEMKLKRRSQEQDGVKVQSPKKN